MKTSLIRFALVAVAGAALVTGCKGDGEKAAGGTTTTTAASTSADEVVLEVDGEKVRRADVESAIKTLPPQTQQAVNTPEGKKVLADELVRMKLLEAEAERLKLDDDPEIKRAIELSRSKILAGRALEKLVSTSEADLQKAYDARKNEFEAVQVRQLLVAYQGSQLRPRKGEPLPVERAEAKARELASQLRAGTDFAKLLQSSDDPTIQQNGGVLEFLLGAAPPEIRTALATAKPGEVVGPVKTSLGFHIFQMGARQMQSFERVKPMLEQEGRGPKVEKVMTDLKAKAKITYNEEYFGKGVGTTPPATATSTAGSPAPTATAGQ